VHRFYFNGIEIAKRNVSTINDGRPKGSNQGFPFPLLMPSCIQRAIFGSRRPLQKTCACTSETPMPPVEGKIGINFPIGAAVFVRFNHGPPIGYFWNA
jgi:hypothetical protein